MSEYLLEATRLDDLPRALPDRPRVVARIKVHPEDFEVEEVPIYPPTGEGTHLFLWVEKRDCSGGDLLRRLGAALGISPGDIGAAGTKDRRAVTRQWLSVPAECEGRLPRAAELDNIRVLSSARHDRKLRLGHLQGNRFRILLRGADPALAGELAETARLLEGIGFPNFFGVQRFGFHSDTLLSGLRLLANGGRPGDDPGLRRLGHFERRMVISAVQSALFNRLLAARLHDGLGGTVLKGDVMQKTATGGLFWADDAAVEQARLDSGETRITGPMFGHKMMGARDDSGIRETAILEAAGIEASQFKVFAKLAEGTRRALLVRPTDLAVEADPDGIRVTFFLPKGCYASVMLREFASEGTADADL